MTIHREPCQACGRRLIFLPHERTGTPAPIEAAPNPNGNVLLLAKDATGEFMEVPIVELGVVAYRVLGKKDLAAYRALSQEERDRMPTYISHFVGCPEASRFHREARA